MSQKIRGDWAGARHDAKFDKIFITTMYKQDNVVKSCVRINSHKSYGFYQLRNTNRQTSTQPQYLLLKSRIGRQGSLCLRN